jgi:hypothetical protein
MKRHYKVIKNNKEPLFKLIKIDSDKNNKGFNLYKIIEEKEIKILFFKFKFKKYVSKFWGYHSEAIKFANLLKGKR